VNLAQSTVCLHFPVTLTASAYLALCHGFRTSAFFFLRPLGSAFAVSLDSASRVFAPGLPTDVYFGHFDAKCRIAHCGPLSVDSVPRSRRLQSLFRDYARYYSPIKSPISISRGHCKIPTGFCPFKFSFFLLPCFIYKQMLLARSLQIRHLFSASRPAVTLFSGSFLLQDIRLFTWMMRPLPFRH